MTSVAAYNGLEHPTQVPDKFNFAIDVVDAQATSFPDRRAILWTNDTDTETLDLSYGYFSQRSHASAQLLNDLGVNKGDVLMLLLPRVPAWWEIATGALRAGIVVSPYVVPSLFALVMVVLEVSRRVSSHPTSYLSPTMIHRAKSLTCSPRQRCTTLATPKDIAFRAKASGAKILVGDTATIQAFLQVRDECPTVKTLLQADGEALEEAVQYGALMQGFNGTPDFRYEGATTLSSDPAFIFFTSGTTGFPKMVVHNHLYSNGHVATGRFWLSLEPGKLYWSLAEQGWAKAAWSWFSTWNCGAALFIRKLQGSFSPRGIVETMHRYPITTLCVPPTAFRRLVLPDMGEAIRNMPPSHLEHCVAAGEALESDVIRKWREITGIEIKDGYGQTETPLIIGNFPEVQVKPGSMGVATPGLILSVVDENGAECKPGVEGDIALATRDSHGHPVMGLFEGYLQNDGSKQRKVRLGASNPGGSSPREWYLTGDRATRDDEGYFWFIGRADDVINSSGYRIGPSEVEAVLQEHPAVLESAVVASPSVERGDVVKAFIILTDSAKQEDPAELIKKIQEHCKKTAAPYKYPRRIEFVGNDFFPKTVSGKIQKAKLRELEKRRYAAQAKL